MTTRYSPRRTSALLVLLALGASVAVPALRASDSVATPPPPPTPAAAAGTSPAATSASAAIAEPEKKEGEADPSDVVQLGEIRVSAAREGQAAGMAMQKLSVGTKVVAAADAFGDVVRLDAFVVSSGSTLGATPGGAQDIRYFRAVVSEGGFPHPATITAEGLFSEHDLPLREVTDARDLLVLTGEGMRTQLLTRPDVTGLAQIGFASGLDPATWRRDPLNLVAVVDKSGSMSGQPLDLVKSCLQQVLKQLGPDDQLSIVLYGDESHVHLAPTRTTEKNRASIGASIDAIVSAGSTNMEEGLRVGFELARASQKKFRGRTRVMQFTDERPNVGDTSAEGFMGLMEAASRDGIGQTTIGVGVQFGAELATKISAVRGGNLFFFPEAVTMTKTFTEEFDTFVTELAHDLDVVIRPAPGLRIAAVYGVPGEMLKWEGGRNVRFAVTTIFLSRKKGAIYVAFAPADEDLPARQPRDGASLGEVRLSYREVGDAVTRRSRLALPLAPEAEVSVGLQRGRLLVSEYLALKNAMKAHLVQNDQEQAFTLLGDLRDLLAASADPALQPERELVQTLFVAIAKLSGHGESVGAVATPGRGEAATEDEEVIILDHCGYQSEPKPVFPPRAKPQRIGRR